MTSERSRDSGENEPLLNNERQQNEVPQSVESSRDNIPTEQNLMRVISVMVCFGSIGIYSASIGALIPLLENYYAIKDATVAWIFVVNVLGYLLGVASLHRMHLLAGRRGVALAASSLHVLGVSVLATKPIYALALVAYFLFGVGIGFADAGFCAWAASVRNKIFVQGLIHGSFSVGCVIGPMTVAAFDKADLAWNSFYLVMLGAFVFEFGTLAFAFRHDDSQNYRTAMSDESKDDATLGNCRRPIIYCALFYLCYVGIETSLSAWLVTFMGRSRDSSTFVAALASSLFWGGMAIGRFTLAMFVKIAGLRSILIIYIFVSLGLQTLFRFQFPAAVSLSLAAGIGFSFGPMFPAGIIMLTNQLPKSLQVRGCSVAASVGQIGGAGAPFFLGLIATSWGIERLLDLVLFMSVLLLIIWMLFSNPIRKIAT